MLIPKENVLKLTFEWVCNGGEQASDNCSLNSSSFMTV
jgi:hypothetical protein